VIGLIINPVAGLGGAVGLKGTDGVVQKALELGAVPRAEMRAVRMLQHLSCQICTCGGPMGAYAAEKAGVDYRVLYEPSHPSTTQDTVEAAQALAEEVDLLLFCGGDGTARDIISATDTPVLGIPAGVKMYSACFALNPESAAKTTRLYMDDELSTYPCEVLDIDEELYRQGKLSVKLYGYANVPRHRTIQVSKLVCDGEHQKPDIAAFVAELMDRDTTYILGAGTTTQAIGDYLNMEKTLLGVDIYRGGQVLRKDCSETDILEVLSSAHRAKLIVSIIGGQGFIFGRGNQQLSPQVIRTVGLENIIVVATPDKLTSTPHLHVDTGDEELDQALQGDHLIVCGYRLAARKQVV
jgi:predicted polyphosphate/ATP-dependent NAD kinase